MSAARRIVRAVLDEDPDEPAASALLRELEAGVALPRPPPDEAEPLPPPVAADPARLAEAFRAALGGSRPATAKTAERLERYLARIVESRRREPTR